MRQIRYQSSVAMFILLTMARINGLMADYVDRTNRTHMHSSIVIGTDVSVHLIIYGQYRPLQYNADDQYCVGHVLYFIDTCTTH